MLQHDLLLQSIFSIPPKKARKANLSLNIFRELVPHVNTDVPFKIEILNSEYGLHAG